jgi:hypothetical protein
MVCAPLLRLPALATRLPPAPAAASSAALRDRSEQARGAAQRARPKELGERGQLVALRGCADADWCGAEVPCSGSACGAARPALRMRRTTSTETRPSSRSVCFSLPPLARQAGPLSCWRLCSATPRGWTPSRSLVAQLIASDGLVELQPHLLTRSVLQGTPTSPTATTRVALADLFVKVASKMCYSLDSGHFPASSSRCSSLWAALAAASARCRPTRPHHHPRRLGHTGTRTAPSTARRCSSRCRLTTGGRTRGGRSPSATRGLRCFSCARTACLLPPSTPKRASDSVVCLGGWATPTHCSRHLPLARSAETAPLCGRSWTTWPSVARLLRRSRPSQVR